MPQPTQPQPGALAHLLGGEEGLEHPRERLGVHTHAGVADRDENVRPGRDRLRNGLDIGLIKVCVRRLDGKPPAAWHSVAGVHGEVDQRVLELARIHQRAPKTRARHRLQRDGLAQGALKQVGEPGNQPCGLNRLCIEWLAAREGQQASRKSHLPPK